MKKIFGALSLIAILTVAFTSQASANGIDNSVEFVVNVDYPSIDIAVATVEVPSVFVVFNVTENSVNYIASVEDLKIPDIVSKDSIIKSVNNSKVHLPFEVGLTSEATNVKDTETNYSEVHLPFEVGLTSKNI